MKTIDEFINSIPVNAANLEYIARTGKINGDLLASLRIVIRKAQEQAIDLYTKELLFTNGSIIDKADKVKSGLK